MAELFWTVQEIDAGRRVQHSLQRAPFGVFQPKTWGCWQLQQWSGTAVKSGSQSAWGTRDPAWMPTLSWSTLGSVMESFRQSMIILVTPDPAQYLCLSTCKWSKVRIKIPFVESIIFLSYICEHMVVVWAFCEEEFKRIKSVSPPDTLQVCLK